MSEYLKESKKEQTGEGEMNKTEQDLKMDIEAIRKIQTETFLEMENLAKQKGTSDSTITNRLQETEDNNLK